MEDNKKLNCGYCGADINLGEEFRYCGSSYTPYCYNTGCSDGIATYSSHLEPCWWGEE